MSSKLSETPKRPAQSKMSVRRALAAASAVLIGFIGLTAVPSHSATAPGAAASDEINGLVWLDQNGDGKNDSTETGFTGAQVKLYDSTNALVSTKVTAANGHYSFTGLPGVFTGPFKVEVTRSSVTWPDPSNWIVSASPAPSGTTYSGADQDVTQQSDPRVGLATGVNPGTSIDAAVRPRPELSLGLFGPGIIDGTGAFNTKGQCASATDIAPAGDDCGDANLQIRTADALTTVWSITADNFEPGTGPWGPVMFEQVIDLTGGAKADFQRIPVSCIPPPSGTGGTTPASAITYIPNSTAPTQVKLTCNLGTFTEGFQESLTTVIKVSSLSLNGSTLSTTQRVYLNDNRAIPQAANVGPIVVSAEPAFELEKKGFFNRDYSYQNVGQGSEPGYITYAVIQIKTSKPSGTEALQQPIVIHDNLFAYGPDGTTPLPGMEYHVLQCIENPTGWGGTVLGDGNESSDPVTARRSVRDSGTCAFARDTPADPTSDYSLTFSGIDMSGLSYPTQNYSGSDLSAGPFYVASYRVQIFVPMRVIDASDGVTGNDSGSVNLYNRVEDFDPNGISGNNNFGSAREPGYCTLGLDPYTQLCDTPLPSDNQIGPLNMQITRGGSMSKYILNETQYQNTNGHIWLPNSTTFHDSQGIAQPGQVFETYIDYINTGSLPLANAGICDVFDNTMMKLVPATMGVTGAPANTYSWMTPTGSYPGGSINAYQNMWIFEWAHIDTTGDDPIDTTDADTDPNFDGGSGRYYGNWTAQRNAVCDDATPAGGWFTDPNSVPGGIDAVNALRVRAGTNPATSQPVLMEPGVNNRTIFSFQVRNNFFGGPRDGQLVPTGAVGANFARVKADGLWSNTWTTRSYAPSPSNNSGDGDRFTVARASSYLKKRSITVDGRGGGAAAIDNTGSTLAGSEIIWEILSSVSSDVTGPVSNVKIIDVLPPYVNYNSTCTLAITGGTAPDVIEPNTNFAGGAATGYTRLTWNLGSWTSNTAIPNRRICTDSDPLAPTGSSVTNNAYLTTPEIPTTATDGHTVTLDQAGSAQISKTVDRRLDPINDDQDYTVEFANFATAFTVAKPTVIDVFPHNADATGLNARDPGSAYTGTLQLAGAPTLTWKNGSVPGGGDPFPTIGTLTYSKDAPTTINYNPDANASKWCTESGGTFSPVAPALAADCPSSFADVTALKFVSNYDLLTDGNPRQGIKIAYSLNAASNTPGDRYTNRATLDSSSLPAAQFLRSNNVVVEVAGFNLGDLIYLDLNRDGNYDAGIDIPAPAGVPVDVYEDTDASGGPSVGDTLATQALTNANGRWMAKGFGAGSYYAQIASSVFASGGLLENWKLQPTGFQADPNTDVNESVDHHETAAGDPATNNVYTSGIITLSATVPVNPLVQPTGDEPLGDNSGSLIPTVTDAFTNFTLDMAFKAIGSIGDLVWFDANADGIKDASESGIAGAGVTVTWLGYDGVVGGGDDRVFTTTTDAQGNYLVSGLPSGVYSVVVSGLDTDLGPSHDLDGVATVNSSAVTLSMAAADRLDVDFGYRLNFTVGDRIFHDVDGDGKWNGAIDTAVPAGVVVELRAPDGSLVKTTTTDASGLYSFTGVNTGDYYVQIPASEFAPGAKLEKWVASFGGTSDPDNDIDHSLDHNAFAGVGGPTVGGIRTQEVTLSATQGTNFAFTGNEPSGYTNNTVDLGLFVPSTISGHIYLDPNSDNSHAGSSDTPLAGVQVALTGTSAAGNPITLFAITNAAGFYEFTNLPPSNGAGYTITESQPLSYNDNTDYAGSNGGTVGNDVISGIVLRSNQNAINNDFTELAPGAPTQQSASLSGSVKVNGTSTAIAGVLISLAGIDSNGNAISLSTTTNASGVYTFSNVPPSNGAGYTVTETQPAGFNDSTDSVGSKGGTLGNDVITNIVLANGDAAVNYNFTETVSPTPVQPVATLSGSVKVNGTSTGIAGVIITLTGTDANGNAISLSATTGSDGVYAFANVPPSDATGYTVTETHPAGYNDSTDTAGSKGGTAGNDVVTGVVLAGGDTAINYNFTETVQATPTQTTASVSGSVKVNGTSTGIAGVIVTLTGTDANGNAITLSATTGSNGSYNIPNVPPSDATGYTLTETQPAGYVDASDTLGTKGGTLGNDVVTGLVLVGGDAAANYDFTETVSPTPVQTTAAVSGHVKVNGTSTGIAGVILTLTGTDANGNAISLSATTDSQGAYTFTNVPPSDATGYTVTETQPAGYQDSTETAGSKGGTVGADAISAIVLVGGDAAVNYDFTEIAPVTPPVAPASLTGTVTVAGAATPIAGVLVTLSGVDANGNAITLYATTDVNGTYTFNNVPPSGSAGYSVVETQPSGYRDDADVVGSKGGTLGPDRVDGVVLASGDAATGYNFTEVAPTAPGTTGTATVSGSVKVNGTNTGIAGVLITLTGNDSAGNPITLYTTTSSVGVYAFNNVPASGPSGYTITETQPAGYTDSSDVAGTKGGTVGNDVITGVVIVNADSATGYDFTETLPPTANPVGTASLSGVVTINGTTTGIAGVVVTVTGTDSAGNAVNLSTTTAADGTYSFPALPVSDATGYTVAETQPAGYSDSSDVAGSKGGTVTNDVITGVVLVANDNATGYNFTESVVPPVVSTGTATISGSALINGTTTGIAGVLITLTGKDSAGNTIVLTTLSGADGSWSFTNVPASDGSGYTITETQPSGYNDAADTAGTAGGLVNNDVISGVIITNGQTATGYIFTETVPVVVTPAGTGTVTGTVTVQGTATPIAGVVIRLTGKDSSGNDIVLTTTTGADGTYTFNNVPASNPTGYTISETQPAGFVDGGETAGSAGGTATNDVISGVVITNGTTATGYNFTETLPVVVTNAGTGSIAGSVKVNGTSTPIGGVVIYLTGTDSAGNAIQLSTTTEADGTYIFRDIPASNASGYTVTEAQPSGFNDSTDSAGTAGGVVTNDSISGIVINNGTVAVGYNFTEVVPPVITPLGAGSLTGRVLIAGTTTGIANVTVTITGTDINGNAVSLMTVTDSTGTYLFPELPPSNTQGYTVTETQPYGYNDSGDVVGSVGGTLGNDFVSGIVIQPGTAATGYNFTEVVQPAPTTTTTTTIPAPPTTTTPTGPVISVPAPSTTKAPSVATTTPGSSTTTPGSSTTTPSSVTTTTVAGTLGGPTTTAVRPSVVPFTTTTTTPSQVTTTAPTTGGGSVTGSVYRDRNGNAKRDAGERGVPNIIVNVTGTDGISIMAVTDDNGVYTLPGLVPGRYRVEVAGTSVPTSKQRAVMVDVDGNTINADFGFSDSGVRGLQTNRNVDGSVTLAFTGTNTATKMAAMAAILIGLGLMMVTTRRRRKAQ